MLRCKSPIYFLAPLNLNESVASSHAYLIKGLEKKLRTAGALDLLILLNEVADMSPSASLSIASAEPAEIREANSPR